MTVEEKNWHQLFKLGLIIKGVDGIVQLIGGLVLSFISSSTINAITFFFIQGELSEDPRDVLANLFLHTTQGIIQAQTFLAVFLIVHGVVKIFLVMALVRNKSWAYPTSIVIFSSFTLYQLYELYLGDSLFILVVTIIDILVIGLISHEYWYKRKKL